MGVDLTRVMMSPSQRYTTKPEVMPYVPKHFSGLVILVQKQLCHYNAPQPSVQVVDHSFSGDFNLMLIVYTVKKKTSLLIQE